MRIVSVFPNKVDRAKDVPRNWFCLILIKVNSLNLSVQPSNDGLAADLCFYALFFVILLYIICIIKRMYQIKNRSLCKLTTVTYFVLLIADFIYLPNELS